MPVTGYVDLEIGLHRRDDGGYDGKRVYEVDLRLTQPGSDADLRQVRSAAPLTRDDFARWIELQQDEAAYGRLLFERFFADTELREFLAKARAIAEVIDAPLRIRLFIGPRAAELIQLRWELLPESPGHGCWSTSENVVFSRYVSSQDARPARLYPKADLRALLVVAGPADLATYSLAPIDADGEIARARQGLGTITATSLPPGSRATLANLIAQLRRGGCDILYLVCHGAFVKGEPWLWLEDEAGNSARVAGAELVAALRQIRQLPRLVVLASCQSGGTQSSGEPHPMAALGPRVAEAGVPAVVAMQDNISIATASRFSATFFAELQRDGRIDRAMAVARGAVREQLDWWVPVLYQRLRSGRIWYVPGFGDDPNAFEKWPALVASIRDGKCTPILGPGLTDSYIGARRETAQSLAEEFFFPLAEHDREDLPQVAQFLAVNQNRNFPPRGMLQRLIEEIRLRHADALPEDLRSVMAKELDLDTLLATFERMLVAVWRKRYGEDPGEPHRMLASLPFRLYLTTNPDSLLTLALTAAGKAPEVEVCRWRDDLLRLPSVCDKPGYRPEKESPLVYHLFSSFRKPAAFDSVEDGAAWLRSLVLTEDDYFDFLIGVSRNQSLTPRVLQKYLTSSSLLFLGLQLDDWNFRILFRSIMSLEGRERLRDLTHVAVQIDPEAGRFVEPERAKRYLESYFKGGGADISIYWGTAEDFLHELRSHYPEKPNGPLVDR